MRDDLVAGTHGTPGLVLIYMLMVVLMWLAVRRPCARLTLDLVLPLLAAMAFISTAMDSGVPRILTDGLDLCRETSLNGRMNLTAVVTIGYVLVRSMTGGSGASADVAKNGAMAGPKDESAGDADEKAP